MYKLLQVLVVCLYLLCQINTAISMESPEPVTTSYEETVQKEETAYTCNTNVEIIFEETAPEVEETYTEIEEEEPVASDEEIELIALVTMAEAEGECEEGKRLVIDTILNRVDSLYFPDSIHEVVYQKNQFSSMWNGRVDRVEATEEVCQLVREELALRTNSDVVFFTAGNYGKYGNPMFQIGNHYFSSY